MQPQGGHIQPDPGSFRDPLSSVVFQDNRVFRLYSEMGESDRTAIWDFVQAESASGVVIDSTSVDQLSFPNAAGAVEHPKLDLITYPYEWSFSMLKDAALSQLGIIERAAQAGVGVKDATPYNTQFVGSKPLFIDIGSFQKRAESDPWFGYQQFCEMFLYPLMLTAYADVSFIPFMRGSINGIPVDQAAGLLGPLRKKIQKGRLTHVVLHALAQRKLSDSDAGVAKDVADSGMSTELLLATVRKTTKLVAGLENGVDASLWSGYTERQHYSGASLGEKETFVDESLGSVSSIDHCWDIGCNDGLFSRIAANHAKKVLAMDADELVVDRLYHTLKSDRSPEAQRITPLVVDLSSAGGGTGWRGAERPSLFDRSSPDAIIYLAVIHHLALTFNIPVEQQLDLLADITPNLVIEFPNEHDPMVEKLLRNKRPGIHDGYNKVAFENALHARFHVQRSQELDGGTRTIYFVTRNER